MAAWDGTFDPPKKSALDELLEREFRRIDEYEKQFRDAAPLAFWLDPDRWEGIDKPNLRDPGSKPFWMREETPKAPTTVKPVAALKPPVFSDVREYPCGCPTYHGHRQRVLIFNCADVYSICNNCGAGWIAASNDPTGARMAQGEYVILGFQRRYMK